jgi:hypothetical protein
MYVGARQMSVISPYYLKGMIEDWDPPDKPHCSNCSNAQISGPSENPLVTCAAGHGRELTLVQMLRPKAPRQFVPAVRCPDWGDMGSPCNPEAR